MPETCREFYNRINLNNLCIWLVMKKKKILDTRRVFLVHVSHTYLVLNNFLCMLHVRLSDGDCSIDVLVGV